ncbi:hypothetical protein, partial [Mycobacterium sp. 1482292.6]|uniref:hypothetical protein n=1 Tax=Mycobacterium sp. 1482292.6 TaxID=1834081 RepID=UPI000A8B7585
MPRGQGGAGITFCAGRFLAAYRRRIKQFAQVRAHQGGPLGVGALDPHLDLAAAVCEVAQMIGQRPHVRHRRFQVAPPRVN